jgi:NitT/TauT family transport system permease protein
MRSLLTSTMSWRLGRPPASPPSRTVQVIGPVAVPIFTVVLVIVAWQVVSVRFFDPVTFPPFTATVAVFGTLVASGELVHHVGATSLRVLAGFAAGGVVGLPVGLLMGSITGVRLFFEPYVQFFRFIPPIAWLSPMTVWLGVGEVSKIALIFYTTSFLVILNTMAGVFAIGRNQIRVARSMGASRGQLFRHVIVPGAMSHYLVGLRVGMGNAFMTVVAAEMIGGRLGLGFLILDSRTWSATDKMLVGIVVIGLLGFVADRLFQAVVRLWFARFSASG